jgi:hypothetical protein
VLPGGTSGAAVPAAARATARATVGLAALLFLPWGGAERAAAQDAPGRDAWGQNSPSRCEDQVEGAVQAASAGDLSEADRVLGEALVRCPRDPGVLRELAGLRFRQGRLQEAEALALQLLEVESGSEWGWILVATIRYLADDSQGALRAWNEVGRPVAGAVRVQGGGASPDGSPYRDVLASAGVVEGRVLTPQTLALAGRRLEALPAVSRVRLDYRPVADGGADVEVAVTLHSGSPVLATALPGGALSYHLLRALVGELRVSTANPLGWLDRWEVIGVREARLRQVAGALALPAPRGSGTWSWEVGHRVGRFAAPGTEAPTRLEWTGLRWSHTQWVTHSLRVSGGGGIEKWAGGAPLAAGQMALLLAPPESRLAVDLSLEGWRGRGEAGGSPTGEDGTDGGLPRGFTRASLLAGYQGFGSGLGSAASPSKTELDLRLGANAVSRATPLDLYPRFGAGAAATHLLRAGSAVDGEGVVRLPGPGTAWVHGGVEVRRWVGVLGPSQIAIALFSDAVQGLSGSMAPAKPEVHVGTGLRVRVPGGSGWLRLDWAIDPVSGAARGSMGFVDPSRGAPFRIR